jgi:predicted transcriptional regulator
MQSQSKIAKTAVIKPFELASGSSFSSQNPTDQQVYQMLRENGPSTRDELAERTGIARTTVFDALTRLSIRGVVRRYKQPRNSRGRRRVYFKIVS